MMPRKKIFLPTGIAERNRAESPEELSALAAERFF